MNETLSISEIRDISYRGTQKSVHEESYKSYNTIVWTM